MTTVAYFTRSGIWFAAVFGASYWGFSLRLGPCFPNWYLALLPTSMDAGCIHGLALGSLASVGFGAACFVALGPWSWRLTD